MSIAPLWRKLSMRTFRESLFNLHYKKGATQGFLSSYSAKLVNPRGHPTTSDHVWQCFEDDALKGMNDQQILSLFTKGFFGGFVFAPESLMLNAGGWRISPVEFTGFSRDREEKAIWTSSEVPTKELCSVGTKLFGVFQLLDKQLCSQATENMSYVDYGFSSDKTIFAGVHRFSVQRSQPDTFSGSGSETQKPRITISLEGFTCNPKNGTQVVPSIGLVFHAFYARLLFANGIQSIMESRASS